MYTARGHEFQRPAQNEPRPDCNSPVEGEYEMTARVTDRHALAIVVSPDQRPIRLPGETEGGRAVFNGCDGFTRQPANYGHLLERSTGGGDRTTDWRVPDRSRRRVGYPLTHHSDVSFLPSPSMAELPRRWRGKRRAPDGATSDASGDGASTGLTVESNPGAASET